MLSYHSSKFRKIIDFFKLTIFHQEHDMSDDLLNQHAAISDLQQAEEVLVDQHKAINEFLAQFIPESEKLYKMTNSVEYDQDGMQATNNNTDKQFSFY